MKENYLSRMQFSSTPKNSRELLEYLTNMKKTRNPLVMLSLITHGLKLCTDSDTEVLNFYLKIATDFWEKEALFQEYGQKLNIFTAPKKTIAKKAFEVLCENVFVLESHRNKKPWQLFLDEESMENLIFFLGTERCDVSLRQESFSKNRPWDHFHSLMVYAGSRDKIIKKFSLGLAEFLFGEWLGFAPVESWQTLIEQIRIKHRKSAIIIFWYFDRLELMFAKYRKHVDETFLRPLREIILSHSIVIKKGSREKVIDPEDVHDVLRIEYDSWFWRDNQKLIRAAELYINLTR